VSQVFFADSLEPPSKRTKLPQASLIEDPSGYDLMRAAPTLAESDPRWIAHGLGSSQIE
jgi:hypothetical protein